MLLYICKNLNNIIWNSCFGKKSLVTIPLSKYKKLKIPICGPNAQSKFSFKSLLPHFILIKLPKCSFNMFCNREIMKTKMMQAF